MIQINKSSLSKNRTCDIKKERNLYCTAERDSFNVAAVNTTVMATCARMLLCLPSVATIVQKSHLTAGCDVVSQSVPQG